MFGKLFILIESPMFWLCVLLIVVTSIGISNHNRFSCDSKNLTSCSDKAKICARNNEVGQWFNIIVLVLAVTILVLKFGHVFFEELSNMSSRAARYTKTGYSKMRSN